MFDCSRSTGIDRLDLGERLRRESRGRPEFERLPSRSMILAGMNLRQQRGDEIRLADGVEQRALARAAAHGGQHRRRARSIAV